MKNILLDWKMMFWFRPAGIVKAVFAAIVALQLVACGGGGGGSTVSGAGSGSVSPTKTTSDGNTVGTNNSITTNSGNVTSTSSTRALTLSWVAPVTRSDGTPLSLAEIDGFHVYYGNSSGNYPNHVNITDSTAQEVTLKNLAAGTYYIVMTTYDADGRESGYSVMVKKTIS